MFTVKQTTQGDSLLLSQQSWLLKSVALELKLTSSNRQRSHTQRLMNLLLDDNPQAQQKGEMKKVSHKDVDRA